MKDNKRLTDREVIDGCIEKAIENGWIGEISCHAVDDMTKQVVLEGILFDHSFCKTLFGKEPICGRCSSQILFKSVYGDYMKCEDCASADIRDEAWQYHIQQLALSEDRINYLRDYINETTTSN